MKNHSDERLDKLLRRWAENRAPTDEHVAALHDRVSSALDEAASVDVAAPERPSRDFTVAKRAAWFLMGVAATALVAFLLWPDPTPAPRPHAADTPVGSPEHENGIPAFAALSKQQLAAKAVLWDEMETMFTGRLRWAAESGDKVAMGILPEAGPARRGGPPMAIRLVVVSRKGDDTAWTRVWAVDVVTRGEEVVALTREDSGVGKILLWTYPMPDGMVAVDGRIALPDPLPVDSSYSGIQREGTTKAILSMDAEGVEYRVFQSIAVVDEEMG